MVKINIKKISLLTLVSFLSLQIFYTTLEPSVAHAVTDNVVVTLTVDSGITISDGAAVTMAPNISVSDNGSIGSSSWVVTTNDTDGYTLAVKASASPALVSGGNSFADYTEAVAGTPEVWSVPGGAKEFGYSAYGTDVSTSEYGTGASCGSAGVPTGTAKYEGFETSDNIIATRAAVTPTTGITTTICFAAEQDTIFAASGVYTATITGTAVTL
jgi:hypothetical protein